MIPAYVAARLNEIAELINVLDHDLKEAYGPAANVFFGAADGSIHALRSEANATLGEIIAASTTWSSHSV